MKLLLCMLMFGLFGCMRENHPKLPAYLDAVCLCDGGLPVKFPVPEGDGR